MKYLKRTRNNINNVRSILNSFSDDGEIHRELDRMINSTDIFYSSLKDFKENFPDSNDMKGKINLIIRRKK